MTERPLMLRRPITSTLPVTTRRERPLIPKSMGRAGSTQTAQGGSNHRILVVDDEPDVRAFCRFLLEEEGYSCGEAADGVEALERAQREPYDLILMDIDMPRMTGTE